MSIGEEAISALPISGNAVAGAPAGTAVPVFYHHRVMQGMS